MALPHHQQFERISIELANRFYARRVELGLKHVDVAASAHVSTSCVMNAEDWQKPVPSIHVLTKIAAVLDMELYLDTRDHSADEWPKPIKPTRRGRPPHVKYVP